MAASDLALLIARCLIAAMFGISALDKFRAPQAEVQMIAALHLPAPRALERLTGAFEAMMLLALVFGVFGRVAAWLLAAFVLFVSFAFLRFWSFAGPPDAKIGMRNIFFANLAVTGGLIVLAISGPGALAILPST